MSHHPSEPQVEKILIINQGSQWPPTRVCTICHDGTMSVQLSVKSSESCPRTFGGARTPRYMVVDANLPGGKRMATSGCFDRNEWRNGYASVKKQTTMAENSTKAEIAAAAFLEKILHWVVFSWAISAYHSKVPNLLPKTMQQPESSLTLERSLAMSDMWP